MVKTHSEAVEAESPGAVESIDLFLYGDGNGRALLPHLGRLLRIDPEA